DVHQKWIEGGNYELCIEDVQDEIWDMVKPADPLRITLSDLLALKQGGTIGKFHTPSHFESTDDEAYDEVTQGDNVKKEKLDEDKTNEEEEVNELYNDVNINLEGRYTKMTDALLANSSSVSSGFISKMLNPNPDTDRVKSLEDDFSEFKQTNLFAKAVSSIPGIVDTFLANKMNEAVKIDVQLQSDRLRDEAQAKNTVMFKRRRDDEDGDKEPSAGSNWGSHIKSLKHVFTEDHTIDEISQHPDWFKKPAKPLIPGREQDFAYCLWTNLTLD
nr:probable serine/threonine-protein phosphatase 2A regulatory subunit B'' subunit TON2 [Tanacetum cinerariifolium]